MKRCHASLPTGAWRMIVRTSSFRQEGAYPRQLARTDTAEADLRISRICTNWFVILEPDGDAVEIAGYKSRCLIQPPFRGRLIQARTMSATASPRLSMAALEVMSMLKTVENEWR